MDNINLTSKSKELRYVTVYNKLFKMINEGTFLEDSRLPSEPDLAKELGISRTTLRLALALLQDDGLIKNIRGKGNYIIKKSPPKKSGLEKIGHIIYKCIESTIDFVEMEFKIEPPSDYITKILEKKPVAAVSIDRWYIYKNNTIAYTFTIIPIETISSLNIDLNNKEALLNFIEKDVFNKCNDSTIEIKFSTSGNFATKKHPISSEKQFFLIEEKLYIHNEFPMIVNKHYLPIHKSTLKFHPKK